MCVVVNSSGIDCRFSCSRTVVLFALIVLSGADVLFAAVKLFACNTLVV